MPEKYLASISVELPNDLSLSVFNTAARKGVRPEDLIRDILEQSDAIDRAVYPSLASKKSHVLAFFGTQRKVAELLNISSVAVSKWDEEIPPLRAYQIERITNGALKAEPKRQPEAA